RQRRMPGLAFQPLQGLDASAFRHLQIEQGDAGIGIENAIGVWAKAFQVILEISPACQKYEGGLERQAPQRHLRQFPVLRVVIDNQDWSDVHFAFYTPPDDMTIASAAVAGRSLATR